MIGAGIAAAGDGERTERGGRNRLLLIVDSFEEPSLLAVRNRMRPLSNECNLEV